MTTESENPEDVETNEGLWLVFLAGGQCMLEEDGEQCWCSDADDDFTEEFGDAFLDPDDAEDILAYLVDEGHLTEDEADHIEIDVESVARAEVEELKKQAS